MRLSLKKYLLCALKWLIPFIFLETLICLLYFTKIVEAGLFAIVNVANFIFLLIPGVYYFIMFFVFKKKCENFIPIEGVVANWKAGFFKYTGGVIVKVDENEYSTSAYFSSEECKELVGKTISYAIISETLFIYEIKD